MPDYRHRIETTEAPDSYIAPQMSAAGALVVVGTAPVNMAENPAAAVNEPVLAYSFAEAKAQLGYSDDFEKYTLCQVMDNSFRKAGVGPVIFINVLECQRLVNDKYCDADDHRIQQNTHDKASPIRFHPYIAVIPEQSAKCNKTEPDEKRGRFLLSEVMRAGNFGHADERVGDWAQMNRWERLTWGTRWSWRLIGQYPREVFWHPYYRISQYIWRLFNGYL